MARYTLREYLLTYNRRIPPEKLSENLGRLPTPQDWMDNETEIVVADRNGKTGKISKQGSEIVNNQDMVLEELAEEREERIDTMIEQHPDQYSYDENGEPIINDDVA